MGSNLATFAARARVIDLLGREQIADAPTAISELLKNAIDAGARETRLRYHTDRKLLELEDDGLGMRRADLLSKWLVVATESKRGEVDGEWLKHADAEQREAITGNRPFGEKGIGRLAVSSLGRAVLVWTRWGKGKAAERTLLLVHWDLFRHPRLTLDDVKVPFLELGNRAATAEDACALCESLAAWLESAKDWDNPAERLLRGQILEDLREVFPASLEGLGKFATDAGTLFAILGTTMEVDEALRAEHRSGESLTISDGLKALMAFSDPFGAQARKLAVAVEIDGKPFLDDWRFWRGDDLQTADHELDLRVTADGFVTGKVRRFGETFDYQYQVSQLGPRASSPGPFSIRLGYIAGVASESRLPTEQWNAYDERLRAYGALYVYRDGVRLLPYGRTDHDFLDFEVRRSLNAGRYFFSHRRMFGAVYLRSTENAELREKAGREGFIKNSAYRGFRDSLVEIFIDLAKTYFSTDPLVTKPDRRGKNRRSAADRLKRRAEKERETFLRDLETWRRRLPLARAHMQRHFEATDAQLKNAETQQGYRQQRIQAAYDLIDRGRQEFAGLVAEMGTEPPVLSALSRTEQQVFDSYLTDRQSFEEDSIKKLANFSARCGQIAQAILGENDRVKWIRQRIEDARTRVQQVLDDETTEVGLLCERLLKEDVKAWRTKHEETLFRIVDEAAGQSSELDTPERLKAVVEALARMEIELREVYVPFWKSVKGQLESLQDSEGSEELLGNLHRRTEMLEEQSRVLGELAQLGLVVESLDHEYRTLFYNVEQGLRAVAGFVKPEGKPVLKALAAGIESLESKQNLLTPLHQRRTSATFDVSGGDIRNFLERLFPESRRQGTKLEFTPRFLKLVLPKANQATIFASTANLVANSLYWVSRSSRARVVRLDALGGGVLVSDSGPGVAPRDRPRIFEAFFGRRPNGRGLGLYIARTNLEVAGYQLHLLEDPPAEALPGAAFLIAPAT